MKRVHLVMREAVEVVRSSFGLESSIAESGLAARPTLRVSIVTACVNLLHSTPTHRLIRSSRVKISLWPL